ncbi:pilus assembly protein Flp/PilA [Pararobbsia alpina]|uniref:Flp family type IVb pilin n=1 Tax=Pararobbsia alpina TaxID=621374 RepID=UPI0039A55D3F
MRKLLNLFVRDDSGVSAMEYAILAGVILVALTAIGSGTFQTGFSDLFTHLFTKVQAAAGG